MQMTKERTPERTAKLERVLKLRQKDLTMVMANVHDPHNVSAILRSCDAFGVPKVHLYYTDTAFPKLGNKSSASARKWVDVERHDNADDLMKSLRAQGMKVLATSCSPKAKPLRDYDLSEPTAVIMGNEHRGTDPELVDVADGEVYIPMFGMIQSFNVSVAAAVILSEASRQRQLSGKYEEPTYTDEEYKETLEDWLER
ncbi:tRNA (guanosine(18)-2'-O)-methyltransferase [Halodesulfovibrio sp. MK-HDV]|nr:tRNA (guanosine(18)-2'-O)-methyltransferase [Halodesulfovibrio sp. MK-HDV]